METASPSIGRLAEESCPSQRTSVSAARTRQGLVTGHREGLGPGQALDGGPSLSSRPQAFVLVRHDHAERHAEVPQDARAAGDAEARDRGAAPRAPTRGGRLGRIYTATQAPGRPSDPSSWTTLRVR